jgi:hypothetical protein
MPKLPLGYGSMFGGFEYTLPQFATQPNDVHRHVDKWSHGNNLSKGVEGEKNFLTTFEKFS